MALTSAMEDVMYDRKNFNTDSRHDRHPEFISEKHFYYHLQRDDQGCLRSIRAHNGEPLVSPRCLREICVHRMVSDPQLLKGSSKWELLPATVYPLMLSEAILLREAQSIVWVVSRWPTRVLRVIDIIPLEDCIEDDYLSVPFDYNDSGPETCIVDCFVLALLKLKPLANLKYVDFSGFDKDRRISRELSRLPILWMKPEDRTVENIHEYLSDMMEVTKDKVQKYLTRISFVYSNIDEDIYHGNKIEPVTIFLDLRVQVDDVPLGLGLQRKTPFRFCCSRLWMQPIVSASMNPSLLSTMLDVNRITHFEYEDPVLSQDELKFDFLLVGIASLRNLFGLSLPNTIDTSVDQQMAIKLNVVLQKLRYLQRINLEYCNLKGQLHNVLMDLRQRINYVNLKDCRLAEEDLFFLLVWKPISRVREINLSCNNLQFSEEIVLALLERMSMLTCLSLSYSALTTHSQVVIVRHSKECSRLKTLCLQGYTPLSEEETLELLHVASHIRTLQKVILFPEAYAFPGQNDTEREWNKYHTLRMSYRYLAIRRRDDIELE